MSIRIKLVSDVACPWCFIGQRTLQKVVKTEAFKDTDIIVNWEPYIVNPNVPEEGVKLEDYYMKNWGTPLKMVKKGPMAKEAKKLDFDFNWDRKIVPSIKAHCLIEAASAYNGKEGNIHNEIQNKVVDELMDAFFLGAKDISDEGLLKEIARKIGVGAVEIDANGYPAIVGNGDKDFELTEELLENTRKASDANRIKLKETDKGVPFFDMNLTTKYKSELVSPSFKELEDEMQRLVNEFYFHKYGGA